MRLCGEQNLTLSIPSSTTREYPTINKNHIKNHNKQVALEPSTTKVLLHPSYKGLHFALFYSHFIHRNKKGKQQTVNVMQMNDLITVVPAILLVKGHKGF